MYLNCWKLLYSSHRASCYEQMNERSIPTWQGRCHDQEGGFPRWRLSPCTGIGFPQIWDTRLHNLCSWGTMFTLSPLGVGEWIREALRTKWKNKAYFYLWVSLEAPNGKYAEEEWKEFERLLGWSEKSLPRRRGWSKVLKNGKWKRWGSSS